MYGILGEDNSDVDTLKVLIRRLHDKNNLQKTRIAGTGYQGAGELLKKGARGLKALSSQGCTRFIVARDADQKDIQELHAEVVGKIINPSKITGLICIVIPVQEIEAWLLADLCKAVNTFPSWTPSKDITNPESISKPKEEIIRLISKPNGKSLYNHTAHNQKLAEHISLELLAKRCPSFKPLEDLVIRGKGNL